MLEVRECRCALRMKRIDVGTVEKTIQIDEQYCQRFVEELDVVSKKIVNGKYPGLRVSLFEWVKPYDDVRTYIKDPETGKVVVESYGRSGNDITHTNDYTVLRCTDRTKISEMIYSIRKQVYDNHQRRVLEAMM